MCPNRKHKSALSEYHSKKGQKEVLCVKLDFENKDYERHKRIAFYVGCSAAVATALFLSVKYLFFPFLAAWLTALLLDGAAGALCKKTGLPRLAVSVFLALIILTLLAAALFFIGKRIYSETLELLGTLTGDDSILLDEKGLKIDALLTRFGLKLPDHLREYVAKYVNKTAGELISKLTASAGNFAAALPERLVSLFVYLMSTCLILSDLDRFENGLASFLPNTFLNTFSKKLVMLRKGIVRCVGRYARAYLLILVMTFGELFIAFSILRIDFAMLIAAIIAFVDLLPALGVGTVLVPWAVVMFLVGRRTVALGLAVTAAVIFVIRQISEPHIVGAGLGLSPLLTLFSAFVGYRLCGLVGIILSPIVAIALKDVSQSKRNRKFEI